MCPTVYAIAAPRRSGEQHHEVRELEHRGGKRLAECEERPALLLADQRQRNRQQQAEDDDLQHVAFRHGLRHVLGEGTQHHVGERLRRRARARGLHRLGRVEPRAGLRQVDRG
jgi:hypothetical protein